METDNMAPEEVEKLLNDPVFIAKSTDKQIYEWRIEFNNETHKINVLVQIVIALLVSLNVSVFIMLVR